MQINRMSRVEEDRRMFETVRHTRKKARETNSKRCKNGENLLEYGFDACLGQLKLEEESEDPYKDERTGRPHDAPVGVSRYNLRDIKHLATGYT